MRLTISDIAKKTGYAKSTVSAALNNKPGVKPKTREEIQRIAAEMNYIPNEFARNLSMQTTNTIGIIVRDITNPFYAKICRAIENTASEHAYTTLILNTDGIREKDGQKLEIRWLTYPSRQELPLLAESAQATLKEIGMDVQVNCTSDNNTIRKDPTLWDVYASAMVTAPTGDPEHFFTSCTLDESASNNGHYHSDKLEDLEKQMKQEFDADKRSDLGIQMQQTILDDNAYVFCSHLRMSMIMQSNVTGLTAHPCDYYELTADLDIN